MNIKFPLALIKAAPTTVATYVAQHEGVILPVGSIVFSGLAVGASIKNSRDILNTLDTATEVLAKEQDKEVRKKIYMSVLRDLAPKVGPIIIFYGASVTCTILNKRHTDKKIAELTAALGLAQNAIAQYQIWRKEAEKELGDKIDIVNKTVAEEVVKNNPNPPTANVPTANEVYCYYDIANQRKIWSDRSPREIADWAAQSSYDLYDGNVMNDIVSLNDLYEFLAHGPGLNVQGGDYYVWRPDIDYHGQRSSDLVKVWITPYEFPDGQLARSLDTNAHPSFR